MKSIRIRAIVLLGLLGILVSELVGLGMVGASVLHTNEQLNTKNSAIDDGSSCGLENSVGSYSQCPNAPFAIPAEYVHASYGGTPSWLHPGVDFTDRTTDSNKARQPTSLACPGDGVWDLGVPDEAPVYAAYDGFVDGFHYANEVLLGIYIRHENVTVNDQTYPVICTYYEHMANASTGETTVFPQFRTWNAPVQKGDQIGRIGTGVQEERPLHTCTLALGSVYTVVIVAGRIQRSGIPTLPLF